MNINLSILFFLYINVSLISISNGLRTKDQMYEHFDGRMSCFRRLNATHQTGCSSKSDGSTGIVHYVEEQKDLDFILKTGSAGDYIPILPTVFFTRDTLKSLKDSGKVSGLIVYNDGTDIPNHYSHELTCPNSYSNIDKTCEVPWNKYGTGILHEDIPFPIYYINNNEDLKKIKDCFEKFNNFSYETQYIRSLCSIELDAFMHATTNTPTCIRRSNSKTNLNPVKFCDPLGGDNVWASLFPIKEDNQNNKKQYIILATHLDTTSLFYAAYPGAVNPITGIVTLLTTADLLKRMVADEDHYDKNILFMLFSGETYDYIGSQRMVYDMKKNEFPMKSDPDIENPLPLIHLDDISLFIELSQLSNAKQLFAHLTNIQIKNEFYKKLKRNGGLLLNLDEHHDHLPPSSLHSFVKANGNISGLVLANHGYIYENLYYNSVFDNVTNINYLYYNTTEQIPLDSIQYFTSNISKMLALSLYEEAMGKNYTGPETSHLELVNELYNCYLLNADCKVHQAIQKKKLSETSYNNYGFYVGVTVVPNILTYAIGLTLGWLTGDIVTSNKICIGDYHNPVYQYFNMSRSLDDLNVTECFRTTMNFTDAISPAFIIPDYDWSSNQYSSWTESTWKDLTVRMFLKPSAAHERFTVAVGSITFIMSLILVYFIKSRSHIIFITTENCSPTSC